MSPQRYSNAPMEMSLETYMLEVAYLKACRQVEVVFESEKSRQLRLQMLLLENEKNELFDQLAQADGRIDDLEVLEIDGRNDLEAVMRQLDSVQYDLRTKTREVERLKAELNSLSEVTTDSTRLLTEKLLLSRELSNLKTELEHLRSQNLSSQSLLAEKLSLQRQLSSLQVEVENERRCNQRLTTKMDSSSAGDANLEARLEAVRTELAKEKQEKHNANREAQKATAFLENKLKINESRLDAFRDKLKSTKESLKEVQSELQRSRATHASSSKTVEQSNSRSRNFRKRAASEMDVDTMIGTPGDLPAPKKGKAKLTVFGEKSTFSTTPFLNRTASLRSESPVLAGERSTEHGRHEGKIQSPDKSLKVHDVTNMAVLEMDENIEPEDQVQPSETVPVFAVEKGAKPSATKTLRKTMATPKLQQVAEEDPHMPPEMATVRHPEERILLNTETNDGPEKKKVKRKFLGGKTLFDESDGDALKSDRRRGGTRGFDTQGGGLSGAKVTVDATGGFGPFSPLKKDRRALKT